jgi:RNA polymerase sigma-70 factor, ECF subfamily
MQYRRDPDIDLVRRCQSSRSPAEESAPLDALLRRYQERIARWCLRVLRDPDDAADCAQEVLWRISRGVHGFRGSGSFASWAYSLTFKVCSSAIERRCRLEARESVLADLPEDAAGVAPSAVDELAREEATATFRRLVASKLTPLELDALDLHHVDGISVRSITRLLDLKNASGARALLASARRKLFRALSPRRLEDLGWHSLRPLPSDAAEPPQKRNR